jgi:hypothetical protein
VPENQLFCTNFQRGFSEKFFHFFGADCWAVFAVFFFAENWGFQRVWSTRFWGREIRFFWVLPESWLSWNFPDALYVTVVDKKTTATPLSLYVVFFPVFELCHDLVSSCQFTGTISYPKMAPFCVLNWHHFVANLLP